MDGNFNILIFDTLDFSKKILIYFGDENDSFKYSEYKKEDLEFIQDTQCGNHYKLNFEFHFIFFFFRCSTYITCGLFELRTTLFKSISIIN